MTIKNGNEGENGTVSHDESQAARHIQGAIRGSYGLFSWWSGGMSRSAGRRVLEGFSFQLMYLYFVICKSYKIVFQHEITPHTLSYHLIPSDRFSCPLTKNQRSVSASPSKKVFSGNYSPRRHPLKNQNQKKIKIPNQGTLPPVSKRTTVKECTLLECPTVTSTTQTVHYTSYLPLHIPWRSKAKKRRTNKRKWFQRRKMNGLKLR